MVKETTEKPKKPGRNGNALPPGGRPPGVPNKATTQAREAIALFVEGNVDRLNGWLDAIAEESPTAAFDRFMSVVEYHIPKLARSEVTGKDGEAIKTETTVNAEDKAILDRYLAEKTK